MPSQDEIRDYLQRSGDASFRWEHPLHEFTGGWFSFIPSESENCLIILQAYGDAKAIRAQIHAVARAHNLPKIRFATQHRGAAMARLFGGNVIAEIIEIEVT